MTLVERPVDEIDEQDELDEDEISDDETDDEAFDETLDEAAVELEDEDLDSEDTGDEDADADDKRGATVGSGDDDESDEASLDELLARRAAKASAGEPEEDIMTLVGGDDEPVVEQIPVRAQPISDRQEFVCKNCRLVKPKVQLADAERGLCRDCV